ncbi:hypothetical protein CEUSTIGMA_g6887.t1 [Chlamydomonas eustigma]|uniref:C2H2-type domain-containing protein n=1 Tax=Chlamydomonas eustigma TaxID=1157962 RepID=A0A250X8Q7_9CHLO|nr:hypothetical protein CEUSTIGMA_g6887.t1 [Chlamydomonas eustigma]|eukprot:GAX79446.1 hypothetical protein CEUSTIGMA_g6887.t1 [Chlamydomonas eustigma]
MPWFICDNCGDSIKKPSLQKHFGQCRGCYTFTCIDCSTTFDKSSVMGHNSCVTEHQKYALCATKPGGFASQGFKGQAVAAADTAPSSQEPTGLEFLSSRPPWKCSVCNVSCTSQETLMAHAAGVKHKRRARAATAAAGGEGKDSKPQGMNTTAAAPAPVPKRVAPDSSSSDDSSSDEEAAAAGSNGPARITKSIKTSVSGSPAVKASNAKKPVPKPASDSSSSSGEDTSEDEATAVKRKTIGASSSDPPSSSTDEEKVKTSKKKTKSSEGNPVGEEASGASSAIFGDDGKMRKLIKVLLNKLNTKGKMGPKVLMRLALKKLELEQHQLSPAGLKILLKLLESKGVGRVEGKKLLKQQ